MSPELAAIIGAHDINREPWEVRGPAWSPGYNPRTGTWAPPGDKSYDTSGYYQPIPLAKPLGPGERAEDYIQQFGSGGAGGRVPFMTNVTNQTPRQTDPMEFFMRLLEQFQRMKPQQQQMPQLPSLDKIMQMIGPIMQQLGPMLRGFQGGASSGQPSAPPPDTTSVFD